MNNRKGLAISISLISLFLIGFLISRVVRNNEFYFSNERNKTTRNIDKQETIDIELLGSLTYKRLIDNPNIKAGNRIITVGNKPGTSHIFFEDEEKLVLISSSNSIEKVDSTQIGSLYLDVRNDSSTLTTSKPENLVNSNAYLGINNHPNGEFIALALERGSAIVRINGSFYVMNANQSIVISNKGKVVHRGNITSSDTNFNVDIESYESENYLIISTSISNLVSVGGNYLKYDKSRDIYSIPLSKTKDSDIIKISDPLGNSSSKSINKLMTDKQATTNS